MKLTFLGAAHEVTGSCYLLECGSKRILVDFGMQQGPDEYEYQHIPVSPNDIDFVFLTHAHIDHSGRLPLLCKHGFKGRVFCTKATQELCEIMLRDSAHIQEFEAEWKNRKRQRSGDEHHEPLYSMQDAEEILKLFTPCKYNEVITVCEGVIIRFVDVGHLLGSASIEVWLEEQETHRKIVFSGDIGNKNQPLIKDPAYISDADYVVMESTYGDRNHSEPPDYAVMLAKTIESTFERGGNLIIPSFAVGRTQELLYFIREIKERDLVKGYGHFRVYVDSPLAIEATNIFSRNTDGYYDNEAMALIKSGVNPIRFSGLKLSVTSDESKQINFDKSSKVIISASGMCEAGRIRHHLKHNLWRPECTVAFVGYQAEGTLGRALLNGAKTVRLFSEQIRVRARIENLQGISGHADQDGLLEWLNAFRAKPARVFVTHGELSVCDSFAALLNDKFGHNAVAPDYMAAYDLIRNALVSQGVAPSPKIAEKADMRHQDKAFLRLMSAGERLMDIIRSKEGGSSKSLSKIADQLNALMDKWER